MAELNPDFVYSENLDTQILAMYESGASNVKVAIELGITLTQYNNLRAENPKFNTLCEFGENIAQAKLEEIALEGAQGKIKNFNNTILQFLLKAQFPDAYNDKKGDKEEGDTLLEQLTAGSLKIVRNREQ